MTETRAPYQTVTTEQSRQRRRDMVEDALAEAHAGIHEAQLAFYLSANDLAGFIRAARAALEHAELELRP